MIQTHSPAGETKAVQASLFCEPRGRSCSAAGAPPPPTTTFLYHDTHIPCRAHAAAAVVLGRTVYRPTRTWPPASLRVSQVQTSLGCTTVLYYCNVLLYWTVLYLLLGECCSYRLCSGIRILERWLADQSGTVYDAAGCLAAALSS